MNPLLQRFLPPCIVLATAAYLGWPPAVTVDYSGDVRLAKSIGWKPKDLDPPSPLPAIDDPFAPVLLVKETVVADPTESVVMTEIGPSEADISNGLTLSGVAKMGGQLWGVINGRPRLPGDTVLTSGKTRLTCQVIEVHPDHVVVRCESTVAVIRPNGALAQAGRSSAPESARPSTNTRGNRATPAIDLLPDTLSEL
ncbi:MAG: hypothetical protein AAGA03_06275 [Planctomycetota bacterium]